MAQDAALSRRLGSVRPICQSRLFQLSQTDPRTGFGRQINPRKSKEKGLDFLGFLWPNRDFSMGYGESK
jgi:hypothetical protein